MDSLGELLSCHLVFIQLPAELLLIQRDLLNVQRLGWILEGGKCEDSSQIIPLQWCIARKLRVVGQSWWRCLRTSPRPPEVYIRMCVCACAYYYGISAMCNHSYLYNIYGAAGKSVLTPTVLMQLAACTASKGSHHLVARRCTSTAVFHFPLMD